MLNKVVTVFGGSGFVGRSVVQRLAKKGALVRVACRNPEAAAALRPMGFVGQITPIFCDIRDPLCVSRALQGANIAINLVGILFESSSQKFSKLHEEGARTIAKACKTIGVDTLIHVSALGGDESSDSQYGQTKLMGEKAVRSEFKDAIILRPSVIFGPNDQFLNKFSALACISPALPLIGGGHTKFQPVYVGDVAEALIQCLEDEKTKGHIFELGGPKVYTFKELLEWLLQEIKREKILLPLPFPLAYAVGRILQILPNPLLTVDQVKLLKTDAIVTKKHRSLKDLHISPSALETIAPSYLMRYRPQF